MPDRRTVLGGLAAAALAPIPARAHHGWVWAEDEEFSLTGLIRAVRLGNPHGELDLEAADGHWTAEIGQPYRNDRAGLTDEQYVAAGAAILPDAAAVFASAEMIAPATHTAACR